MSKYIKKWPYPKGTRAVIEGGGWRGYERGAIVETTGKAYLAHHGIYVVPVKAVEPIVAYDRILVRKNQSLGIWAVDFLRKMRTTG